MFGYPLSANSSAKRTFRFPKALLVVTLVVIGLICREAGAESHRYRLVWTDDPAVTMTVGWCQLSGTPVGVKYSMRSDLSAPATETRIITRVFNNTNTFYARGDPIESHFVKLTGLTPDTAYYFAIADSEGDSETMWFKTAPGAPRPFAFVAGGDSHQLYQKPQRDASLLISRIRPLFVMHGGDYADVGTNAEMADWLDEWQMTRSSDGRMYPLVPAHGNHENNVTDFAQRLFNVENVDAYQALGFGGNMMRLWTLNTELEPLVGHGAFNDIDPTERQQRWDYQTAWLSADLAANPDCRWKVVNYHRPMRPHTREKPEGLGRTVAWANAFYANGVDLAIECDTHCVKYTFPLRPSNEPGSFEGFIRDDAKGTMYIGEGGWGAPSRPNDDDKPWTLSSGQEWQFNLVQVAPESLTIRKVQFGREDKPYDSTAVKEISQAVQDADPFAMPEGLEFWSPLAGASVSLPFAGADVDNRQYVGAGADWLFSNDDPDPGSDWTDIGYDDTNWPIGRAQLGYGDGDEATVIGHGHDENDEVVASYFRKAFIVDDPGKVIKLRLLLLRDDGAVVYLNGAEALRSNMPEGEITSETTASAAIDGDAESIFFEHNLDPSLLVTGSNVVAVEVHQSESTSSDLSFDMALYGVVSNVRGDPPAGPTDLEATALSRKHLQLIWNDNAQDEVGQEIWRNVDGRRWEIVEHQLGANATAYQTFLRSEATQCAYKVRAYSQYGLSDFSNEVSLPTPSVQAPVVWSEDFNSGTFGQVAAVNVTSGADWAICEDPEVSGGFSARINGYGADSPSDDWLITPPFDLFSYTDATISADLACNYDGPELEICLSADYDPALHTDPGSATWWTLPAAMPPTGDYTFGNTGLVPLYILGEDFENNTFGAFAAHSALSNAGWAVESQTNHLGAIADGSGADGPSDDWLISPSLTLPPGARAELVFDLYRTHDGPFLEVMVSTDYAGGDPSQVGWDANTIDHTDVWDEWDEFAVDLADYSGDVTVAFRYTSTGTSGGQGARIGVDNIAIRPRSDRVYVGLRYVSTGTGFGDGRVWEVDNLSFRANPVIYLSETFDGATLADSVFTAISILSNADWKIETRAGVAGAAVYGYGADGPSDDWLISPAVSLTPSDKAVLVFDLYRKYDGPSLEVMISTDYAGGDPTSATWESRAVRHDDISDTWKRVLIDLSGYEGNVTVAFRYTSTGTGPGDGAMLGVGGVRVQRAFPGLSVDIGIDRAMYTTVEPVSFSLHVTGGYEPYACFWEFGDGDTSTQTEPLHIYATSGTYTVTVTVSDSTGARSSVTKADLVKVLETAHLPVPLVHGHLRVATFNTSLSRDRQGALIADLSTPVNEQARKVAEIIQRTNPDVILLNEFDSTASQEAVKLFKSNYLEVGQSGAAPIGFPYTFSAETNTGIDSGFDLNNDGETGTADDCYGYGDFPGQYGMALLSKYPVIEPEVRTFQLFLWKDMPGALLPDDPATPQTADWYSTEELDAFRLSSKSHWDIPVDVNGKTVHLLCSHPTLPEFNGEEDRDGRRNHDEIRFWADYVSTVSSGYIHDDTGRYGGLGEREHFVILGSLNADPGGGERMHNAVCQLINHSLIFTQFAPASAGAAEESDDATDTASCGLRADYVLPSSAGLEIVQGGVFWPIRTDDLYRLTKADGSSDHRLVWVDLDVFDARIMGQTSTKENLWSLYR